MAKETLVGRAAALIVISRPRHTLNQFECNSGILWSPGTTPIRLLCGYLRRFDPTTSSAYDWNVKFTFDAEYNARLYDARRVTFEDALEAISVGHILFHFKYPGAHPGTDRLVFVIRIESGSYFVPYTVSDDVWQLETVYPLQNPNGTDNGATGKTTHLSDYLNDEERRIIETLGRVDLRSIPTPVSSTLSRYRRSAKKFLTRQKRGKLNISGFGPQQDREHAGKLGSQSGVARRW